MHPIPIIFQQGSYGTYLLWVLQMLFTNKEFYNPFDSTTGSSHYIQQTQESGLDVWLENHSCFDDRDFFRIHPKIKQSHSFLDNTHKITAHYKKSILVYPSKNTYLLHIHNYVFKIWCKDIWSGPLGYLNKNDLYDNFPVKKDTPLEQVPPWIIREWLSYNLFNSMDEYLEWYLPDQFSRPDCLTIFIDELLYSLPETVNKLENFFSMSVIKDISNIVEYHKVNLASQKHLTQDNTASLIIDSIKNQDTSLTWNSTDLTFITESYIQQQIRNLGYDFKCAGLNQFPTTSRELIKLL